jgi:hypothetical protein
MDSGVNSSCAPPIIFYVRDSDRDKLYMIDTTRNLRGNFLHIGQVHKGMNMNFFALCYVVTRFGQLYNSLSNQYCERDGFGLLSKVSDQKPLLVCHPYANSTS